MNNVIPFVRFKACDNMSLIEIRDWLKEHGWVNVRFHVENLDHVIAERLKE